MTDERFKSWMERLAAEDAATPGPDTDAIWWRAQLRQRVADRDRLTKPLRVAEKAICVLCFSAAVAAAALLGPAAAAPFLVVTLVAAAGATALVLRGTAG